MSKQTIQINDLARPKKGVKFPWLHYLGEYGIVEEINDNECTVKFFMGENILWCIYNICDLESLKS